MSQPIELVRLRQIYNDGRHNAFTDLARFREHLYLTFRNCPEGHMLYDSSRILVLRSTEGEDWELAHAFDVPGRDVRDPHLLVFHDRLYVYSGTWLVADGGAERRDLNEHLGYAVWSRDGVHWEGPLAMPGTEGHYIWRAAVCGHMAYLCGRRKRGFAETHTQEESWALTEGAMLQSGDGLSWRTAALFRESHGDETAFLFEDDGAVLALCRGREGTAPALICRSRPPYEAWQRTELPFNLGGPLLARWGSWPDGSPRYLVGGRNRVDPERPVTILYWLLGEDLVEALRLPSGGDNSYPGFVGLSPTRGLLSYYSSHEAIDPALPSANIYLAELRI